MIISMMHEGEGVRLSTGTDRSEAAARLEGSSASIHEIYQTTAMKERNVYLVHLLQLQLTLRYLTWSKTGSNWMSIPDGAASSGAAIIKCRWRCCSYPASAAASETTKVYSCRSLLPFGVRQFVVVELYMLVPGLLCNPCPRQLCDRLCEKVHCPHHQQYIIVTLAVTYRSAMSAIMLSTWRRNTQVKLTYNTCKAST